MVNTPAIFGSVVAILAIGSLAYIWFPRRENNNQNAGRSRRHRQNTHTKSRKR